VSNEIPTIPGTPLEGGFYAGRIRVGDDVFALIVAPKAEGDHDNIEWGNRGKEIANAGSYFDGRANTVAMAEAGSEVAQWALQLRIAGFEDWYLPSRDELEICYRNLKPTTETNYVWRHGDNPSSVPVGYPYSQNSPAMTTAEPFRENGAEAFVDTWYWTSTLCSAHVAWSQDFGDGLQFNGDKVSALRARAVRRFKVIN